MIGFLASWLYHSLFCCFCKVMKKLLPCIFWDLTFWSLPPLFFCDFLFSAPFIPVLLIVEFVLKGSCSMLFLMVYRLLHHGQNSVSWSPCLAHELDLTILSLDLYVFGEYGSSMRFSCSLDCWNPSLSSYSDPQPHRSFGCRWFTLHAHFVRFIGRPCDLFCCRISRSLILIY